MKFKDNKGNVLYGYSQINLDKNTEAIDKQSKTINRAITIGGGIALLFWLLCVYILYQIMRWNLFTKFVNKCVCWHGGDKMSEIIAVGSIFAGIGAMVLLFVVAYWMYQLARLYRNMVNLSEKYDVFEEMAVDKVAKENGFDLVKEQTKRSIMKKRTFRKEIEKKALEDVFGKEE